MHTRKRRTSTALPIIPEASVPNYIQFAIPFFFLFIAIEAIYAHFAGKDWYHLPDSLSDLGCGAFEQIVEVFYKTAILAGYFWLYEQARFFSLNAGHWAVWAACLILVDLGYYWFHRASHRIHLIWAGHGPHHQSEEYNLTVALRQGALERCFSWVFWLPLALLGFPPLVFIACNQLNVIYQFFVHTKAIHRLGFLEHVMNTPSHHRVHHGKNPRYIDKNYGGMFIVWDKLFGTFEPESEAPVYGTVKPLHSWNPLWANAVFFRDMATYMQGRSLGEQLQILWRPPGWTPEHPEPDIPSVNAATYPKYATALPLSFSLVLSLQFGFFLLVSTVFLEQAPTLPLLPRTLAAVALLSGLIAVAGYTENSPWLRWSEPLRLLLSVVALALLPLPLPLQAALAITVVGLTGVVWALRSRAPSL